MFRPLLINFLLSILPLSLFSQHVVHIIAHRGASAYAPENTIAAFKKAIELGADILELDVHQTKDNQIVVIHDGTVDRTTNGKGRVQDFTLKDIRSLDAGSWFSPKFIGERIPTLDEVFGISPDSVTFLIELKDGSEVYPGIEERVVELIRRHKSERRVILKSFEDEILGRFRVMAPEIPRLKIIVTQVSFLGLIIQRGVRFGTVLGDSVQYLQHHWFGLTDGFIQKAHREGYKVFVWDVDDRDRMKALIERGIDGIETDHPDWVKSLLQ